MLQEAYLGEQLAHGSIGWPVRVLFVTRVPIAAAHYHQAVAAPLPAQHSALASRSVYDVTLDGCCYNHAPVRVCSAQDNMLKAR